jgi:glycine cleavage system H protein
MSVRNRAPGASALRKEPRVADYQIPDGLRYTREDEWVRVEGDRATIGVSDYAQQQLGDVVYVELPEPGRSVERGEPFGVIESVKAVADLFAPLSGQVVEVNSGVSEQPEAVNDDCYGEGWMIVLQLAEPAELDSLLSAEDYRRSCGERDAESA